MCAWWPCTVSRAESEPRRPFLMVSPNAFTEEGREKLATAATAWQRYLKLEPRNPDPTLARLMAGAYSETGLNEPAQAASAMEIVTEKQPSASAYSALAQYAYLADQLRKGDLAAARAVQLAPEAQRRLVRSQLELLKREAIRLAAQDRFQREGGSSTTPAPAGGGEHGVG